MKKILFIIPTLQGGGAEKLLTDILNGFDYEHYEVHLMYFYEKNVYLNQIPENARRIVPYYIKTGFLSTLKRGLLKVFHLEDAVSRRIIRNTVDSHYDTIISFLHGMALHVHTYLLDRADRNISFVHFDFAKADSTYIKQAQAEYARMDIVAFVSKQAQDSFEKEFGTNRSEHVLLPNFIDIEGVRRKSEEFKVEKKFPTFVSVGRLEKEKGFELLIDIAVIMRGRLNDFCFRIVGAGSEEKRLREMIIENHLLDVFDFVGFQKNPYPYIVNADVLLSTSLEEGFGLVICEAMSLGVPVVASNTAGAQSLLGEGAGILVNRNPNEYVEAILQLMQDTGRYQQYVEKGKKESLAHDKNVYMPNFYRIL